jgi:alcohol dehydrogenase class IV
MVQAFSYEALPGRVIFGAGSSRARLGAAVAALGLERVLLVATPRELPNARALAAALGERVAGEFTNVRPHVPLEIAEAARAAARDLGADGLLAIGGGSTIGTAKAVALEQRLPIVAVPTTYAGSEMTPIYGLTSGQRKQTGRSLDVLPRLVVYDPELTLSLPPAISGPSAINALAHCVEAFYAPGANPISALAAEEGIRALARSLPTVVAQPADLAARSDVLYGAYLAGAALAVTGTGIHHKICHVLGGAFNLPHAELHTVILPHAVAFNAPALPAVMARIAAALGAPAGESAARAIRALADTIGAPGSLRALGMRAEQIAAILPDVLAHMPADNPRPVDAAGIRALLENAFAGRMPE